MTSVTHSFVSTVADVTTTGLIKPSHWNDDHVLEGIRSSLTANQTYYVNGTTGSNTTGDGTFAAPWETPQFAWDYISANIDAAGFIVTIQIADGTYDPPDDNGNAVLFLDETAVVNQGINIIGNISTPGNVIFNTGAGDGSGVGIWISGGHQVYVDGIKFAGGTGKGIFVLHPGGKLYFYQANVEFGSLARACHAYMGEIISYQSTITINGNMEVMYTAEGTGNCDIENTDHVLTGTPAFSTCFASAFDNGVFLFYTSTFTGAATGSRFSAERNGVINGDQSLTFLPGSTVGTLATGGVYGAYTDYDFSGHIPTDDLWSIKSRFLSAFPASDHSLTWDFGTGAIAPVNGDTIATFRAWGVGSNSIYNLRFVQTDVSGGSEDCRLDFRAAINGTLTTVGAWGAGLQVGTAPTGGDKGLGTINVATDIYKNNLAYTNPDYVLERYFTGSIERFKDNDGADRYSGITPLDQLEDTLSAVHRLPAISDAPMGVFERSDVVLEKLEEAYCYIIELHKRLEVLEQKEK